MHLGSYPPRVAGPGHGPTPEDQGGRLRGRFRDSLSRHGGPCARRDPAVDDESEADGERAADEPAQSRQETFNFLGYTFERMVYRPTRRTYLAARPSQKAMAPLRERVRGILTPRNIAPWPEVAQQINQVTSVRVVCDFGARHRAPS